MGSYSCADPKDDLDITVGRGQTCPSVIVHDLRCELQAAALGIDARHPEFSWILHSPRRGAHQTSFRVLVGDRPDLLARGESLHWDSGTVRSSQSSVRYRGRDLISGDRHFWTVQVEDEHGEQHRPATPGSFEMGKLSRADWNARWIGMPALSRECTVSAPSAYLRREFAVSEPAARARLYVSARGVYAAFLNGRRVGRTHLAPGWTDYRRRILYQVEAVEHLIKVGPNAVGAVLADGWYAGTIGPEGRRHHYGTYPLGLLLQLEWWNASGERQVQISDGSWKCGEGAVRSSDLLMGETVDLARDDGRFSTEGFDDSSWSEALELPPSSALLVSQPAHRVVPLSPVHEARRLVQERHRIVVDFGRNLSGFVRLDVEGAAGCRIVVRHAERIDSSGALDVSNLRSARATDEYLCGELDRARLEPRFTEHGFRYAEIRGEPSLPPSMRVAAVPCGADLRRTGEFDCSDPAIVRLHESIFLTLTSNFQWIPTDCPQRDERLGWMGDAQLFAETACYLADVQAFFRKWLDDVEDARSPAGIHANIAPRLVNEQDGMPGWGDACILVPWTLFLMYGDLRILERHFDGMCRWVRYYEQHQVGGLLPDIGWGDWWPVDADSPKTVLNTAYFALVSRVMSRIAHALGRKDESARFASVAQKVCAAFQSAFVQGDGRILGDTQTVYALAIHFELLDDSMREGAARHLVEDIERRGGHPSTGFIGTRSLLPALSRIGRCDVAYRLLQQRTFPSWGFMIETGPSTLWERWNAGNVPKDDPAPEVCSLNHYALGSVGQWLYQDIAGIRPDAGQPGFARILLEPQIGGGLTFARARYQSVRGPIASEWFLEDSRLRWKVELPANTSAGASISGYSLLQLDGEHIDQDRVELKSGAHEILARRRAR